MPGGTEMPGNLRPGLPSTPTRGETSQSMINIQFGTLDIATLTRLMPGRLVGPDLNNTNQFNTEHTHPPQPVSSNRLGENEHPPAGVRQLYSDVVRKAPEPDRRPRPKQKPWLYTCYMCLNNGSNDESCKLEGHKLMSKEDYEIMKSDAKPLVGKFPPSYIRIDKSDIVINCDAAFGELVTYAVVIRDSSLGLLFKGSNGPFKRECFSEDFSSYDAETMALHFAIGEGLKFHRDGGNIHVFTDCLPVSICFNTGNHNSCGGVEINRTLINQCREAASLAPWTAENQLSESETYCKNSYGVYVHHIFRELNKAADLVAKNGKSGEFAEILKEDVFLWRLLNKKKYGQ